MSELSLIVISPFLGFETSAGRCPQIKSKSLNDQQEHVLAEVCKSLETLGFMYITGHGIAQETIDSAFSISAEFFSQDETEKKATSYRAPVPRGYIGTDKENFAILAGEKKPNDLVEKFRIGPFITEDGLPEVLEHDFGSQAGDTGARLLFSDVSLTGDQPNP